MYRRRALRYAVDGHDDVERQACGLDLVQSPVRLPVQRAECAATFCHAPGAVPAKQENAVASHLLLGPTVQALVQFGGDAAEQVDVLSWERLAETPDIDVLGDLELCVNRRGFTVACERLDGFAVDVGQHGWH